MKKLITIICAAMGIAAFGEATKYVKSNETIDITDDLSVDQFSVEAGTMIKDGEGTLEIGAIRQFTAGGYYDGSDGLNIIVSNGTITTKSPLAPIEDETLADTTLAKAYLHYDASVVESVVTNDDGIITMWKDLNGNHDAVVRRGTPTNRIARLNGLNTIDFCSYKLIDEYGNIDGSDNSHRAWMEFDRVAIRSGVIIFREIYPWDNSAFVIGDTQNYQFHRAQNVLINYFDGNTQAAGTGEWHADGVRINQLTYQMGTDYHLYSFRLNESAYTSTLCNDRAIRIGGAEIAEVAYFEGDLTDDELRAVEEKLLAKWFGKSHPAEVPSSLTINTLSFGEDAEPSFGTTESVSVIINSVACDGVFTKNGVGTMTINSCDSFSKIAVNGGKTVLKGHMSGIFAKAAIHVDPSDLSTVTTNDAGQILRIESANGNGHYLVPVDFSGDPKPIPTLMTDGPNAMPVIDCGPYSYGPNGLASALMFDTEFYNCSNAFVVVHRADGSGSFLLGASNAYNFHSQGGTMLVSYAGDGAQGQSVVNADWYVNNEKIPNSELMTRNFTNELAVYTVANMGFQYENNFYGATVSRLGSDRDAFSMGGIKYGEVIIFQCALSEDEIAEIKAYLMNKWLDIGVPAVDELDVVAVGAGSELKFHGGLTIADEGSISLGFPSPEAGALTIVGPFVFGENPMLELTSDRGIQDGTYPLIKADSIEGIDSVDDIMLTGSGAERYNCKLHLEDGVLSVTATKKGMTIIIR